MISRLAEAWYARRAAVYARDWVVVIALTVLVLTVANAGAALLYLRVAVSDGLGLLVAAEAAMLAGMLVWVPMLWRALHPLRVWGTGRHSVADAEAMWELRVRGLARLVRQVVCVILLFSLPPLVYGVSLVNVGFWTAAGGYALLVIAIGSGGILVYMFIEAAIVPLTREVVAVRAPEVGAERRGVPLAVRMLLLPPIISFYAIALIGGIPPDSLGPEERVLVVVAVGLAISVTLSLGATVLLRQTVLDPVNELLAAAERVGTGDLDTEAATLADDELGVLTHRFNRMVGDLRAMTSDLRDSRARIVAAADESRRQVERDLHDGAQQRLVLLQLKLGMARRAAGDGPVAAMLEDASEEVTAALAELRELAHGIYPAVLQSDGLPGALREAARRAAIPTEVDCNGAGRYPPEVEAAVYFCCLEALQNAAKHAGEGARATVTLGERDGTLRFAVADDGRGYAGDAAGRGLQNMRDRIGALGGRLEIGSAPGEGTRVEGYVSVSNTLGRPAA